MMMKKVQQGFTLIELMIVVAIIAILAAIALPMYSDYTARAQMSEALVLADGQKGAVTEYYSDKGVFPANNASAGVAAASAISGKYVDKVEIGSTNANSATIVATMKGAGVSDKIKDKTLTLTATAGDGTIKWECTSDAGGQYVPATCR